MTSLNMLMKKFLFIFLLGQAVYSAPLEDASVPASSPTVVLSSARAGYYATAPLKNHLMPEDYVLCAHGGKFGYLERWLLNPTTQAGYNLEYLEDEVEKPKGIQVTPLFVVEGDQLSSLVDDFIKARSNFYAVQILKGPRYRKVEEQAVEDYPPAVLYVLIKAKHLREAPNMYESAIEDGNREHILGYYIKTWDTLAQFKALPTEGNPYLSQFIQSMPEDLKKQYAYGTTMPRMDIDPKTVQRAEAVNAQNPLGLALKALYESSKKI